MNPRLFKLESLFQEYEHVQPMNVLGSSDVQPLSLAELSDIAGCSLPPSLSLGYTEPIGTPELLEELAARYRVPTDRILVTAGANEAVFLTIVSSLEARDCAVVCRPAYQSFEEAARIAGATIRHYCYDATHRFRLDLSQLLDEIALGPRLVVLNTPHNPTAKILADAELDAIMESAIRVGTTVIVDEVMHGIVHRDVAPSASAARFESAVVIGSTSKVFGLGGLRVGWIIGPPQVIRRCTNWRHYTTICAPAVSQWLAAAAIRNADVLIARANQRVRENYGTATSLLATVSSEFDWLEPQGGTTMLVRLRRSRDTEAFCRSLADQRQVFVVPCDVAFGMPAGYLRIGLGGATVALQNGVSAMIAHAGAR